MLNKGEKANQGSDVTGLVAAAEQQMRVLSLLWRRGKIKQSRSRHAGETCLEAQAIWVTSIQCCAYHLYWRDWTNVSVLTHFHTHTSDKNHWEVMLCDFYQEDHKKTKASSSMILMMESITVPATYLQSPKGHH